MNYGPDLTTAAIKMVFALGVVLAIVWGLQRLAKGRLKNQTSGGRHKLMQLIGNQYVGVKKSVAMVQIPGSILVLGIGADSVRLLTQIDDKEIIDNINAQSSDRGDLSFKDHLKRLTNFKQVNHKNNDQEIVVK